MRTRNNGQGPTRQAGMSLIEVLVALLVLSIGLLGMARLQTQSLRWSTDAYARSQATVLAYDIIDRMRANRTNLNTYLAANLVTLNGQRANCNPTLASVTNDLQCWLRNVSEALPGGVPTIAANATDATMVDVTLTWRDREPREYTSGDSPRLPGSSNECLFPDGDNTLTALAGRLWDVTLSTCMVSQTWTVQP